MVIAAPPARCRVTALACPRCGGTPVFEGTPGRLARCSSCGVLGRIDDPEGTGRVLVEPSLAPAVAADRLAGELARRGETDPLSLHGTELLYVPFWRIETLLVGRVRGRRVRREKVLEQVWLEDGQVAWHHREKVTGEEVVDQEVQRVHVAIVSACPLEEHGLPTLDRHRQMGANLALDHRLEALGRLVPFDPAVRKRATVLDPLVPRPVAVEEAAALRVGWIDGLARELLPGAQVETVVLAEDVLLTWYPLVLCRFRVGHRRGSALVDAVTGHVAAVRLPPRDTLPLDLRLVGTVALGTTWLVGSLARLAFLPPAWLSGPGAADLRARLLFAAGLVGLGVAAGLRSLLKQLEA